jgi:hypothetical protein
MGQSNVLGQSYERGLGSDQRFRDEQDQHMEDVVSVLDEVDDVSRSISNSTVEMPAEEQAPTVAVDLQDQIDVGVAAALLARKKCVVTMCSEEDLMYVDLPCSHRMHMSCYLKMTSVQPDSSMFEARQRCPLCRHSFGH